MEVEKGRWKEEMAREAATVMTGAFVVTTCRAMDSIVIELMRGGLFWLFWLIELKNNEQEETITSS